MRTTATPQRSAQPSRLRDAPRLKAFRALSGSLPAKVPGTLAANTRWQFLRGFPLFLAIVALAAAPLFNRTLGQVAVGVLFALMLWTALRVRRKTNWVAPPTRRGVKTKGELS